MIDLRKPICECPNCDSTETREDYDYPKTMRCCEICGCDYIACDGEIIFNPD